jgi:hypothetical protein
MKPPKRRAIPLGTDPDFCYVNANRLYVPLRAFDLLEFPATRQDLCFEYADDSLAEKAIEVIQWRLTKGNDHASVTLRNTYSNHNVLKFLSIYLNGEGLRFLQWTGRVRLTSSSLDCLQPNGKWGGMHVEDLVHGTIDWQPLGSDPEQGNGAYTLPHRLYGLSTQTAWEAVTGISRPVSETELFYR